MKSFVRWSTALSLVGGVLFGSLFVGGMRSLALTTEQVAERLRPVPVFTLTDAEGAPLVATQQGQEGTPVAGVFISMQDAENFLNNLRQSNPDVARNVQVTPVSLAEVYQLAIADNAEALEFAFIPIQQQVQVAVEVLRQNGENVQEFEGVPLFIARSGGQENGYLTIQQGEQQVIPIFFTRDDLQAMLEQVRQRQPELTTNTSIQVVNLEGLINTLQNSENQELNRILLVPPRESIEFIQSLPREGEAAPPAQQQPRPAAPR
ncbi:MAG: Tic22 family protein [Oculatellaceae cyanobacterium bins.114]|nr:Tic22 family protein [Oculatellaceae cyanobacterium bins.114]